MWPKWLTKTLIKTETRIEIVPYYFSVNAQNYRDVIDFLKAQLEKSEDARKQAEKAARQNLYPDAEVMKGLYAAKLLKRMKMEIDLWTAS